MARLVDVRLIGERRAWQLANLGCMSLVIGVDSSTQSVKVEIRELESGALVSIGRAAHPPTTPPKSEQEPTAWWDAMQNAAHQALNLLTVAQRAQVVAISVAGQQHGMVALDESGSAVHPGKLWNDTESANESDGLVASLGAAVWASRSGSVPVPAFTITKIAWLRAHHPDSYMHLAKVLLPHDFLTFRLTGAYVTDRGDASGSGYWSPQANDFDTSLLDLIDPERTWGAHLPTILSPTSADCQIEVIASHPSAIITSFYQNQRGQSR